MRDLVEQARHGDHEAFTSLVAMTVDRMYATAFLIVRDRVRAEDAVQDAFLRAWRDLPRLRDADRFESWLRRILVNACYDALRRQPPTIRADAHLHREPSVEDETAAVMHRDALERAFARLTAEQRAIVVLTHVDDLSNRDTAEALGIPVGTAKSRLHHALRALRGDGCRRPAAAALRAGADVSADERDPRVAAWLHDVEPAQGPVELLDRVAHATAGVPQVSGSLAGRGWAWAGVIAAGAAALALLVTLPDGPFRSADVPSPSAGTSLETVDAQPSSTIEPSPSPTASEIAISGPWEVAAMPDPRPEPGQGELVRDVTAGGPGFVAVGRSYPTGDDPSYDERDWTPAIWTSVDGLSWELVPDLGALGPADLHAVASGPDSMLLALGMDLRGYGPDEVPPTDLGMWSSADGVTWTRIPAPPNHWLIDVVATEEEWLVVGAAAGADPDGTHTVWRSSDLESWSASALPGGSDLPHPHVALVLGPDGRVLVTGCRPLPADPSFRVSCGEGGRAWVESGGGWEAVDLPFVPWATSGNDERFVSIGMAGEEWAAWTSRDGKSWVRSAAWQSGSFPDVMVAIGDGFVTGGTLEADGTWWPAIWHSRDGSTWTEAQRLPVAVPPHETSVYAVIETPGAIVAMGYAYEQWPVAYRWTLLRDE